MFLIPSTSYKIKTTKHKGRGVFATQEIEGGRVIGDYLGQIQRMEDENLKGPTYTMYYNDFAIIVPSNPQTIGIHTINHSCMPNCDTYTYKGHILVFATRKIFPGEELTYEYIIDPPPPTSEGLALMHPCRCGSLVCHGTMNTTAEIQKLCAEFMNEDYDEKYEKNIPVPFGEELPPLKKYPTIIKDNPINDMCGSTTQPYLQLDDNRVPPMTELRKIIRESGRILHFVKLNLVIYGILNEVLIAKCN